MNEQRDTRIKVDSFYVETRVHGCHCIGCEFNMAKTISGGDRGHHCKFKKITLNDDGTCRERKMSE